MTLCMSCFKESSGEYCAYCGYKEPESRKQFLLPAGTLLHNRYIVGEVLHVTQTSNEYKALDTKNNTIVEIEEYFLKNGVSRNTLTLEVFTSTQNQFKTHRKNVNTIKITAEKMLEISKSPNIVNIYNVFESYNTVYVVKEYLEGMLLKDYVASNGGLLDTQTSVSIMAPVFDGLNQIHKAGFIHRALTTESIIITADNQIKITNFSFLKDSSPYKDEAMTVHFSPGFAPPEQYREKSKQGSFSDIYSAGAILYKITTGKMPPDALNRLAGEELVSPQELNPEIPDHVSLSILKAMKLTPELRFKTVSDYKNCLFEKKDIIDVDGEITKIKNKKRLQILVFVLSAILIVGGVILYKFFLS